MDATESALNNENQVISSARASNLDTFWIETMQKLAQESTKSIEDAAKQMVAIISLMQTIYFAAVSFSSLNSSLKLMDPLVFLFLSPIALWLISLALAISVFIPRRYDTNLESPSRSASTFNKIVSFKQNVLFWSYIVLVAGFLMLLVSIFVYLYIIQVPVKTDNLISAASAMESNISMIT
jgi:hypothetical protein